MPENPTLDWAQYVENAVAETWEGYALGFITTTVSGCTDLIDYDLINDVTKPSVMMPTVNWETINSSDISNYIDMIRERFTDSPVIPDIDVGVIPSISIPDVAIPKDSALVDALKAKLIANLENRSYGLEAADAAGIEARSLTRMVSVIDSHTQPFVGGLLALGSTLPAAAATALMDGAYSDEYARAVSGSDRDVIVGANNSSMKDYAATRESGIKLAAWIVDEYVKEIEALVYAFEAQVDGYSKKVEGKTLVIKAEYDNFVARVKAFAAMADAVSKVADLATKNMDSTTSLYKERISLAVDTFNLAIKKLVSLDGIYLDIGTTRISSAAAVAAAALSQYNASSSSGDEVNSSANNSRRDANSQSHTDVARNSSRWSENINYDTESAPNPGDAPLP